MVFIKYMKRILLLLVFISSISWTSSCQPGEQKGFEKKEIASVYTYYPIKKFIDGDTFWYDDGSPKGIKVRLIGIDAPESRNSGRKKIGYYGKEAAAYVAELLQDKKIRLEYDKGKYDRYQRELAYVYLEDGTFLNAHLVENGYASAISYPPNTKYDDLFKKLEE